MTGSIPAPVPTRADVRRADASELQRCLADDLGVDTARVFLTTGASQANALTVLYLSLARESWARRSCRVCYPEYPPLFDTAQKAGFRLTEEPGPVELAVISQPRNPEGDLWDRGRFLEWASDARWVVVDETFREFAGTRSLLGTGLPDLWSTGSFTKFFAGDDLRVGFVVAPEESAAKFAGFHGLVTNTLAPYSVAGAIRALRDRAKTRRNARAILDTNRAVVRASLPGVPSPAGPVLFDRPPTGESGDALARRALAASVLVCSGSFFGDPAGVRLCLTRRSFPADLAAYLSVRSRTGKGRTASGTEVSATGPAARRRPGGTDRARAAPS